MLVSPKRVPAMAAQIRLRLGVPDAEPDDALTAFRMIETAQEENLGCALITVVDVIGGSARGRGAHMAVAADGRYCGYVSGGCVEAGIAAEAIAAIEQGRDRVLRIGFGSPFIDLRLPCGGGIDLHIHVAPDPAIIRAAIEAMEFREPFRIGFDPKAGKMELDQKVAKDDRTAWRGDVFECFYRPKTRLVLIGRGLEVETTSRIAVAAGFEVVAYCADGETADAVHRHRAEAHWLSKPSQEAQFKIDPYSAVVFLFHDHDLESSLLAQVLRKHKPFFIGALGSKRTHELRLSILKTLGIPKAAINMVRGPVGLFGPTRNAASLALSILAQVTQAREEADTPDVSRKSQI